MAINTVTLTWDFTDFLHAGISDSLILYVTPSFVMADTTDNLVIPVLTRSVSFSGGTGSMSGIIANDNGSLTPAGSAYTIYVFDPAANQAIIGPFAAQINHSAGASQDLSALYANQITPPSPVFNYLKAQSNLSDLTNTTAALANLGLPKVYSPLSYGAAGDGVTDDTTAVRACIAAAIAVQGTVEFGALNFKTTAPITLNGTVKMRGSVGYTKGGIINAASDIFTVTNGANVVIFENCSLTSQAGGGHIFQASGANISDWAFKGTWCQQSNAAKAIWYQYQGGMFDFVVDDNCFWQCAASASVSPVSFLAMPGNCNSIKFGRGRYTGSATMTVPWFVFYPDAGAHTDTNVGFTNGSPTVTDANAVAADLGLKVIHATFSGGSATIQSVNPGVGYTVSSNAGGNLSGQTALIGLQGWYEEIKFDHCTFEVMPAGAIWANGIYDIMISDIACWDVTATADVYHFYKGITGYRCQNIAVRGGRGGPVTGGANNFFADSNCVNILLESFGQGWGVAPVLSSPSGQTTIINGVNGVATPVAQFPSLQLPTVTLITSNQSYTPPTGAQVLDVTLVAGGAGGGSGAFSTSTGAGGGGGGGAGGLCRMQFQVSQLTTPVTVTIGAGGNGGAAVTGNSAGNPGLGGNTTSFGPVMWAHGGAVGAAGNATNIAAANGGAGGIGLTTGGAGGASVITPAAGGGGTGLATGGGGAGGGISATTVAAGSNGGTITNIASWGTPGAGVLSVTAGANMPTSGTALVATSNTVATITYTGVSGNTLTGCAYVSGGTGTVATGGVVASTTAQNGGGGSAILLATTGSTSSGGVVGGASPTNGSAPTVNGCTAPGGGGGAAATGASSSAQQGANGLANTGAGGGGGGACQAGTTSGAGGNGGSGYALIVAYFQ
jgi:hypothetical protein